MSDEGYVNYFEILGLDETANPGEVRKTFKRLMKNLVLEIARAEITAERRAHFLLEMAKLNAAVYTLREKDKRDDYWNLRNELIALEQTWRDSQNDPAKSEELRKKFDSKCRQFLSKYVEECMLEAGRDKECVEASNWDLAHERHAARILRHYRHRLYQGILERLPFYEVTPPQIDWAERKRTAAALLNEGAT